MRGTIFILLLAAAVAALPAAAAEQGRQQPISAKDVDRELVVRFSRAYGMARGAIDRREDADDATDLKNPEQLDGGLRRELSEIIDVNGLSTGEWQGMLARMEQDRELRDRIEALSTPFRYQ